MYLGNEPKETGQLTLMSDEVEMKAKCMLWEIPQGYSVSTKAQVHNENVHS